MNEKLAKDLTRTACAEASAWIVRLHGPYRSPQLEAGFRAWLAASPENARQFELVTAVWDAGAVRVPSVPRMVRRAKQPMLPQRWLAAAAVLLAVVGVAGWSASRLWLNLSYTTGFGEQRILLLSDGSRVTLNSDTRVTVSYRRSERRIKLNRGEAYFEVAKDTSRPFLVRAGGRQVEALGTVFDVRREPQQLTVMLVKGKVAVSSVEQSTPSAVLAPGQRLRVSDAESDPVIDSPRIDSATAWRRGEVMLDGTPLSDAIVEMNRFDRRRLVIDDPTIAAVRISGIYHLGDSELFAVMVARLYGFNVQHRDGHIHLVKRSATFTAEK